MKILVVDDMRSMREVLVYMLAKLGHTTTDEASNGIDALKMLRLRQYDLLITDLHMPNLDGEQLLAKIRSDTKLKKLPVLMASNEDDKARIIGLIAGEVTGFMMKPFDLATLKKQLILVGNKQKVT